MYYTHWQAEDDITLHKYSAIEHVTISAFSASFLIFYQFSGETAASI